MSANRGDVTADSRAEGEARARLGLARDRRRATEAFLAKRRPVFEGC